MLNTSSPKVRARMFLGILCRSDEIKRAESRPQVYLVASAVSQVVGQVAWSNRRRSLSSELQVRYLDDSKETMRVSNLFAELNSSTKCKIFCSVLTGALLGTLLSLLVNSSLVEISLNPFFSFYFGVLFILVGVVILFRVKSHASTSKRIVLLTLAVLVLTSGILSLFFQRRWLFHLTPPAKIPLYR